MLVVERVFVCVCARTATTDLIYHQECEFKFSTVQLGWKTSCCVILRHSTESTSKHLNVWDEMSTITKLTTLTTTYRQLKSSERKKAAHTTDYVHKTCFGWVHCAQSAPSINRASTTSLMRQLFHIPPIQIRHIRSTKSRLFAHFSRRFIYLFLHFSRIRISFQSKILHQSRLNHRI